jgi:transcriptional regulator with XRE-family HTH domain
MTVGEAMRAAREKAGLTQNALATITGISPNSLNQYEKDKYLPRVDTAEMLADSLGISIDEYIGHGARENFKPNVEALEKMKKSIRVATAKEIAERLKSSLVDIVTKEMVGET